MELVGRYVMAEYPSRKQLVYLKPVILMTTLVNIDPGTELLFNYGWYIYENGEPISWCQPMQRQRNDVNNDNDTNQQQNSGVNNGKENITSRRQQRRSRRLEKNKKSKEIKKKNILPHPPFSPRIAAQFFFSVNRSGKNARYKGLKGLKKNNNILK